MLLPTQSSFVDCARVALIAQIVLIVFRVGLIVRSRLANFSKKTARLPETAPRSFTKKFTIPLVEELVKFGLVWLGSCLSSNVRSTLSSAFVVAVVCAVNKVACTVFTFSPVSYETNYRKFVRLHQIWQDCEPLYTSDLKKESGWDCRNSFSSDTSTLMGQETIETEHPTFNLNSFNSLAHSKLLPVLTAEVQIHHTVIERLYSVSPRNTLHSNSEISEDSDVKAYSPEAPPHTLGTHLGGGGGGGFKYKAPDGSKIGFGGGGGFDYEHDTPETNPPVADPPAKDPPSTDPPATDPPATDPPTTEPPAADPPAEDTPEKEPKSKHSRSNSASSTSTAGSVHHDDPLSSPNSLGPKNLLSQFLYWFRWLLPVSEEQVVVHQTVDISIQKIFSTYTINSEVLSLRSSFARPQYGTFDLENQSFGESSCENVQTFHRFARFANKYFDYWSTKFTDLIKEVDPAFIKFGTTLPELSVFSFIMYQASMCLWLFSSCLLLVLPLVSSHKVTVFALFTLVSTKLFCCNYLSYQYSGSYKSALLIEFLLNTGLFCSIVYYYFVTF